MPGVEGSEPSDADTETPPARLARRATLVLLVAGALTAIALVAWSIYVRQTHLSEHRLGGRAGLRSGLELAARLNTEYLAAVGGLGLLALGLAYALQLRRRWAMLMTALGSALTIAGIWYGRNIVIRFEDPHFVNKSPWVKAATFVATVATIYLAVLAVIAFASWLYARRAKA